jgi:GlpG protein
MNEPHFLVSFARQKDAHTLVSYLSSQKISAEYVKVTGPHPYAVKLTNPNEITEAQAIAKGYIENANDTKYQQAAWQFGDSIDSRTELNIFSLAKFNSIKTIPFTATIFFICCVVYGMALFGGAQFINNNLFFAAPSALFESSQWWRLVTPAFIHFSEVHIIFNLLWWWMLGGQLERKFGSTGLILVFLLASISSNLAQFWVSGSNFGGLSGVVYALVGFVWWCGWLRPRWGLSLPKPMIGLLLVWLLVGYADILWISFANTAHTVGLISGCFAAWFIIKAVRKE